MRRARIPQIQVIQSKSGRSFADQFNQTMKDLFDNGYDDPEYRIDHGNGEFTAIVIMSELREMFDCIADEYHAEGIYYFCDDCPYMDDPQDRRVKWVNCRISKTGKTHRSNQACDFFYKELRAGRIEVNE